MTSPDDMTCGLKMKIEKLIFIEVEPVVKTKKGPNKKFVFKEKFFPDTKKPVNKKVESKIKTNRPKKETIFVPRQRSSI